MRRRTRTVCSLLAAITYLGIALWTFRAVLPAPSRLLPEPTQQGSDVRSGRLDMATAVTTVTGNAHRLLYDPLALGDEGPCHPLPSAYTLGEHMLGESLLALAPLWWSGDPILAYNAMLVASLWIAALAMYALALHFTRDPAAAFAAGLLFCLAPWRVEDAAHPFANGDLWGPLVLLFLHRTFARGGIGNGVACAIFLVLTLLESFSSALGVAVLAATYGLFAAVRHRDRVARWIGPLLLCGVLAGVVAALLLGPYLETRATWGIPSHAAPTLLPPSVYGPGSVGFPGWVLLALVLAGLADRARHRRDEEGEDPRLAALVAGLVVWCSLRTVPLAGLEIPSPLVLAQSVLPGLDAVRGPLSIGRVATLGAALVAAYGVVAIGERLGRRGAVLVTAALSALVLGERFVPALALATFGDEMLLTAYDARPADDDVALLRRHARGAVIDLPRVPGEAGAGASSADMLLTSFSPRPTAACDDSLHSPLAPQIDELLSALPAAHAVDALAALGFDTVLLHTDRMSPGSVARLEDAVRREPQIAARIALLGATDRLRAFRLSSPTRVSSDLPLLATGGAEQAQTRISTGGTTTIPITFRNASGDTFRHPEPIAPTPVVAEWRDRSGERVRTERTRLLLPVALGAGGSIALPITLTAPDAPGTFDLTIRRDDGSGAVVAWLRLAVTGAGGPAPRDP